MKPTVVLAMGIAVLAITAAAVADSIGTKAIKPTSATVDVTTVVQKKLRTCSGPAGMLTAMTIDAKGTATSADAVLNGPAHLVLRSVIDNAKGAGTVTGSLRIDVASGRDTIARFDGVYANGKVQGLLKGATRGQLSKIVANGAWSYNPATGQLTSVKIGQTDAGGGAVLVQPGTCVATPNTAQRVDVRGQVTAITPQQITVANVTCAFPAGAAGGKKPLPGIAAGVRVGTRVQMACIFKDQQLVLEQLKVVR
jgi:hypothetical protein